MKKPNLKKWGKPTKEDNPVDGKHIANTADDSEDESPIKQTKLKGKLLVVLVLLFIAPLIVTVMLALTQTLEQANNAHQVCYLTEMDYLSYLALEASSRSIIDSIPFRFWGKASLLVFEVVLSLILLYEVVLFVLKRKNPNLKKESLFKNNKLVMFNFFASLLALSALSAQYTDTVNSRQKQMNDFVDSKIQDRGSFFTVCAMSKEIKLSNKSEIVDNRLSEGSSSNKSHKTTISNSNDTAHKDIVYE